MKKRTAVTVLLMFVLLTSAFSAPYYYKGATSFSFKAGVTYPTFTAFLDESANDKMIEVGHGAGHTGLNIGGIGTIGYMYYVNPYVAFGGELGYSFAFDQSKSLFTNVPITAKVTFQPVQTSVFEMPISFTLGGSYNSLGTGSLFTLFTGAELQFVFYPWDNWGLGVSGGLNVVYELNTNRDLAKDNAIFGYVPITLSVTYRK